MILRSQETLLFLNRIVFQTPAAKRRENFEFFQGRNGEILQQTYGSLDNNKSPPQAGEIFENNKNPPRSGGIFFGNNKTPDRKSGQKFLKGGVFIVIPAVIFYDYSFQARLLFGSTPCLGPGEVSADIPHLGNPVYCVTRNRSFSNNISGWSLHTRNVPRSVLPRYWWRDHRTIGSTVYRLQYRRVIWPERVGTVEPE